MYDRFVNDVLVNLSDFKQEDLRKILRAIDIASYNYEIKEKEHSLTVIETDKFKQIAMAYIITKKTEGMKESSLAGMARIINMFINQVNKPIETVHTNDVRGYLYKYQNDRKITNRTLNHIRTVICTFFKWAFVEGYISIDPTANIRPIKFVPAPRKALNQLELEKVRRACKSNRESCIVEVLYSTGCRISELCSIKISDIDWDKREILIKGKGDKYRIVYINAKAFITIQIYLKERKFDSQYLICNERGGGQLKRSNVEKLFSRIEKETGIFVTPHIMRHTMATQALTGTGVEVVQKMLGHSNIATTMIYAEVDQKNIQSAHDKCII